MGPQNREWEWDHRTIQTILYPVWLPEFGCRGERSLLLAAGECAATHAGASPYGDLDATGAAWEIRVEVVRGGLRL